MCEAGAEEGLRREGGDDVEEVYDGGYKILLGLSPGWCLAEQSEEGCKVCRGSGLGVLFFESGLDCL